MNIALWTAARSLIPDYRAASAIAAAAALITALASLLAAAAPDTTPKRGGTLEFAVLVEPGNYDCHGNISFAFLHPIAPHYSTLLKFDAANYPQIVGDLANPGPFRRIG